MANKNVINLTIPAPEEVAVAIADRYISIQTCSDGYDYTIYDGDYKELDGGVYDNPDISIYAALEEIITDLRESAENDHTYLQGEVRADSKVLPVNYESLTERVEIVAERVIAEEKAKQTAEQQSVIADFRAKTEKAFHDIKGQTPEDIEQTVYAHVRAKIEEYEVQASIVDVVVAGSRCRGLEEEGADLDVIVEFAGSEREDDLFNLVHEDGLKIGGIPVDINPITEDKTGTFATYLPQVEQYLTEKAEQMAARAEKTVQEPEKTVTLTVAECSEFHNLGEFHEGIESVEEALALYNRIPPERMHGIRGIGININTEGTEEYMDVQMDILSGRIMDLDLLNYVPEIKENAQAMEMIRELSEKVKDIEIIGTFPEKEDQAMELATEIDQFSYDFDPYEYKDKVTDRDAQVQSLKKDIENGEAEHLQTFLQDVVKNDGLAQHVQQAKELLLKLSEYKPLAKVEELEEQNYNMVDNVLNNGAGEKSKEQASERISVKERLMQKKVEMEQCKTGEPVTSEKEIEKRAEREL